MNCIQSSTLSLLNYTHTIASVTNRPHHRRPHLQRDSCRPPPPPSRSAFSTYVLSHRLRLSNQDFIISLKRKLLVFPLYPPASVPTCKKCGAHFDIYGLHPFRCVSHNKTFVHHYINEHGLKPTLKQILPTAGIMSASSSVSSVRIVQKVTIVRLRRN